MKKRIFLVSFLTVFTYGVQASPNNTITVAAEDFTVEYLRDSLLPQSSILDLYWYGDDGIDCGEPGLSKVVIDRASMSIRFVVEPFGIKHGCEVNAVSCQVPFTGQPDGSVLIPDASVHPYEGGCEFL